MTDDEEEQEKKWGGVMVEVNARTVSKEGKLQDAHTHTHKENEQ